MSSAEYVDIPEDADRMWGREELAIALDGAPPVSDAIIEEAYQIAVELLGAPFSSLRARLSQAPNGVVAIGAVSDSAKRMLRAIGLNPTFLTSIEFIPAGSRIVLLGCRSSVTRAAHERIRDLLLEGATFVTSDRCATLDIFRTALRPGSPQPPARCRIDLNRTLLERLDVDPVSRDLARFLPAVRLSSGHIPIAPDFSIDPAAWVLASDAQSGDPVAVAMRFGGGSIVHGIPHWRQSDDCCFTELEAKPIRDIPGLRNANFADSDVPFGYLCAAWAMMSIFLAGLSVVVEGWGFEDIGKPSTT
jgi:hypothetical protein